MTTSRYLSNLGEAVAALNREPELLLSSASRHDQTPHEQDELYIVRRGFAEFFKNGERSAVKPDDLIFVEAGAVHRFEAISQDFLTWVVFWGPPGGEPPAGL